MSREFFDVTSRIMDYESDRLSAEETRELFQYLVDTGLINHLQGHYQRTAKTLISTGFIHQPDRKAT